MSIVTKKVYDIPVEAKWYVVHIELNNRTKEGTILVEFQEKWTGEIENGITTQVEIPLEESGPTKKLRVDFNRDDYDRHKFNLFVDNLPLAQYMKRYEERYAVWEIEKLGSKSKFQYDKEAGHFYFKGNLLATPEKIRIMRGEKQEYKHNGYTFRVEHVLERGNWIHELYVNNEWNNNMFVPKTGVNF